MRSARSGRQVALVRAALNAKKRHVGALRVEVRGPDEATALALQALVAKPTPDHTWRQWISEVLEDVLVLDAACVYVWPRRNKTLYSLLPVDAATIAILPDVNGLLPEPPAPAYEQRIAGGVTARLTKREMIYEMMNPRPHSLYGLSPTEVVLHAALTELRRMTGSAEILDSSNMAAFFGELPEVGRRQISSISGIGSDDGQPLAQGCKSARLRCEVPAVGDQPVSITPAIFDLRGFGAAAGVGVHHGRKPGDGQCRRRSRGGGRRVRWPGDWGLATSVCADRYGGMSWPGRIWRSAHTEIREDAQALVIGVLTPNDAREMAESLPVR